MKNFSLLFLLLLFSACSQVKEPLVILHWNDSHASNISWMTKPAPGDSVLPYPVGGYGWLKSYLDSLRSVHKSALTLFAGDEFQGSPVSSITNGTSQIRALQLLKPDFLVPGNHEFDYSDSLFFEYADTSGLAFLCANLVDSKTGKPVFNPGTVIQHHGWNILLTGMITPDLKKVSMPSNVQSVELIDPYQSIQAVIDSLSGKRSPDLIVVISHSGTKEDSLLAVRVPAIDLIVGGHSHTALFKEIRVGKTRIVQAGSRGRFIGEVKIEKAADSLMMTYQLIETKNEGRKPDSAMHQLVMNYEEDLATELDVKIGELKTSMPYSGQEESAGANFITDAFRTSTGTDLAIMNSGGIRKTFEPGVLTKRDIWELAPFGNAIVEFTMTGADLEKAIRYGIRNAETPLHFSGIEIIKKKSGESYELVKVTYGGKPLKPEKLYRLSVNNFIGMNFTNFFGLDVSLFPMKESGMLDRDVLISYIQERKVIAPVKDGRMKIVN